MIPAFTLTHYLRFLGDPFYLYVLWRTVSLGLWVTGWCLLLGYPLAYFLARSRSRHVRALLLTLLLIPLMTSVVVLSYGWMVILANNGLINKALLALGMIDAPVQLLFNMTGVTIALVAILLPYMILTIMPVIQNIDLSLEEASQSLGAAPWRMFRDVVVPLSLPGVWSGLHPGVRSDNRSLRYAPPRGRQPPAGDANLRLRPGHGAAQLAVRRRHLVYSSGSGVGPHDHSGAAGREALGLGPGRMTRRILLTFNVLVYFFVLMPILVVIPVSFSQTQYLVFPPQGFSLRWYMNFFSTPELVDSLWLSLRLAATTTVICTVLGTMVALALVRYQYPGRRAIREFFLSSIVMPRLVLGIALLMFLSKTFLSGHFGGLLLAHIVVAFPYVVRTVSASLFGLDRTLEEAGASLGAAPMMVFRTITLPLLKPGIVAGAIFAFVTSFDELVMTLFLGRSAIGHPPGQDLQLPRIHVRSDDRGHLGDFDRHHCCGGAYCRTDRRLWPIRLKAESSTSNFKRGTAWPERP